MAGLDASVLTLVLHPGAKVPPDPITNEPILQARERVDFLLATLQKAKRRVVIPTPALSEVLIRSGKEGLAYVHFLQKSEFFDIRPFDVISAIELSEINRRAIAEGNKTAKGEAPYQKIKVDRQIVAICKIAGVKTIYACDKALMNCAKQAGLSVVGLHELPLPPPPPKEEVRHDLFSQNWSEIEDGSEPHEVESEDVEED
jgi:predicted nucleic acid-binding protein